MRSRRLTIENLQDRVLMAADLCIDMDVAAIIGSQDGSVGFNDGGIIAPVTDPLGGLGVTIDQNHFGSGDLLQKPH